MQPTEKTVLTVEGLQALLERLRQSGFRTIGPSVRDKAIVYADIDTVDDLPRGLTDEQEAGHYRLAERNDDALFGFAVGPQSWKQFLHPPVLPLWKARYSDGPPEIEQEPPGTERFAFIGVRACELNAIRIQDRVFLGGPYVDEDYRARRKSAFIVALNCSKAGATCFCASMNAGPKVENGFDIALAEICEGNARHIFVAEDRSRCSGYWETGQ